MKEGLKIVFDSQGGAQLKGDASELGPDGSQVFVKLPVGIATAMAEISKAHRSARMVGVGLATDPAIHPDSRTIREWIKDPREFDVLVWLATFVLREWETLPHRTRAQHRELFQRIARLCRELGAALDETGDGYVRGGGFGLGGVGVRQLMTDEESALFYAVCARSFKSLYPDSTEDVIIELTEPKLPSINELLERVASAAQRLEKDGPLHSQPTKRGAKRGYFVRRMGELFLQRHGEQPHEVIAALTTIALGEATDRELVAKLLA